MSENTQSDRAASVRAAIVADQPIPFRSVGTLIEQVYGTPAPHVSTLHRWRLAGCRGRLLPSFLIGARRYVKPSDVRAFLAATNGISQAETNLTAK